MSGTYSKTQQKKSPTLFDMPLDVANFILEKMNPMDLQAARKVNRSLRRAVEKFEIRFNCVSLVLWEKMINVNLVVNESYKKIIEYMKADNCDATNCDTVVRSKGGKERRIKETHFAKIAFNDIKFVWDRVPSLGIMNLQKEGDIDKQFIYFMKSEKCVHVKEAVLNYFSLDDALEILPLFNAETLEIIKHSLMGDDLERVGSKFERIAHLDQWKKAIKIELDSCVLESEQLVYFFHFQSFQIEMITDFSTQTAIQIRDDLMRRSSFQQCKISAERKDTDPIQIAKVFEPEYYGDIEFEVHYLNDNGKFIIDFTLYYDDTMTHFYARKV